MDISLRNNIKKHHGRLEKNNANRYDSQIEIHNKQNSHMIDDEDDSEKQKSSSIVNESETTSSSDNPSLQPTNVKSKTFVSQTNRNTNSRNTVSKDSIEITQTNTGNPIENSGVCLESKNDSNLKLLTSTTIEKQSKRKKGRPRKNFRPILDEELPEESVKIKTRGRPRKSILEIVKNKEKKSVGRPRIHFTEIIKEKRSVGRPKIGGQIKREMKVKQSRGRPRKNFDNVIKEQRSIGRPRIISKIRLSNADQMECVSFTENKKIVKGRGRPRKNISTIIEGKRSRGRPRKTASKGISNLNKKDIISFFNHNKIMKKRGRPRKIKALENILITKVHGKSLVDEVFKKSVGCINNVVKVDPPKRKRGRPKKLNKSLKGYVNNVNDSSLTETSEDSNNNAKME